MTATSVFQGLAQDSTLTSGGLRGVTGPLAKVSVGDIKANWSVLSGTGTATATRAESQDGGTGVMALNCVSAGRPNGVTYYSAINTTRVAIRGSRTTGGATPPVAMIVNGRCVLAVANTQPLQNGLNFGTYTSNEATSYEFPYALKRGYHTVGVRVDANPDGTTVNTWNLAGYVLPRSEGFRDTPPQPRTGFIEAAAVCTTSFAAITNAATDRVTRALSFSNSDTNPHTVTINCQTPSGAVTVYAVIAVPAGAGSGTTDRTRFVFPQPYSLAGWQIKADVNSQVFYWTENA